MMTQRAQQLSPAQAKPQQEGQTFPETLSAAVPQLAQAAATIAGSPRMLAQRAAIGASFGSAVTQRALDPDQQGQLLTQLKAQRPDAGDFLLERIAKQVATAHNDVGAALTAALAQVDNLVGDTIGATTPANLWRQAFVGATVGTEQELKDIKIQKKQAADRKIAYVYDRITGDLLLLITTDMLSKGPDLPEKKDWTWHTAELITTPTEQADDAGLLARSHASSLAVQELREAASDLRNLHTLVYEDLRLVVVNQHHTCRQSGLTKDSTQATIGVPFASLPNLQVPWLQQHSTAELAATAYGANQLACLVYDYIVSAIEQLTRVRESHGDSIFEPDAKNDWGLLPRLPPVQVLSHLQVADRQPVRLLIRNRAAPGTFDARIYADSRDYILDGNELAGHTINSAPTINGAPATLLEYRGSEPHELQKGMHHDSALDTDPFWNRRKAPPQQPGAEEEDPEWR
jgi:hypothetical protein